MGCGVYQTPNNTNLEGEKSYVRRKNGNTKKKSVDSHDLWNIEMLLLWRW